MDSLTLFTTLSLNLNNSEAGVILHEPSIIYNGQIYDSFGRYGFHREELSSFLDLTQNYCLVTRKDKLPILVKESSCPIKKDVKYKTFTIGICAGRPAKSSISYLQHLGFNPIEPDASRDMRFKSNDYVNLNGELHHINYIYVKSSDIITAMNRKFIDAVMCYGDVWYNLPDANYNIKYIGNFVDNLGRGETHVSLISTAPTVPSNRKLIIASEYQDGYRLVEPYAEELGIDLSNCEFVRVSGSVESYLISGAADLAITVVQTGSTLEVNGLYLLKNLRRIYLNLWIHLDPFDRTNEGKAHYAFYTALRPSDKLKTLVLDGIDGSGKSTLLRALQTRPEIHNWICYDRWMPITNATLTPVTSWAIDDIAPNNSKVVIVEADLDTCSSRMADRPVVEAYEQPDALSYFRCRYRELAGFYGYYVISNDGKLNDTVDSIIQILGGDDTNKLPKMATFRSLDFHGPIIAEGESKCVREYNHRFDVIQYKPSVYSHKRQRGGTVEGTDLERQRTTRNLLYLLTKHMVSHTYWCIWDGYILAERIRDIVTPFGVIKNPPPVENCVKQFHVGTHKHIYSGMDKCLTRFGDPIADETGKYHDPLVRFDWRNPNHLVPAPGGRLIDMPHAQIYVTPLRDSGMSDEDIESFLIKLFPHGIPLGDYAMCEDLANNFLDVNASKELVLRAFKALEHHFLMMGIRFKDVCFMPTVDGTKLYGEVSQDCGRYDWLTMTSWILLTKMCGAQVAHLS